MRHSIEELTAFVAVVELGSFTDAAQTLHITQPALSRRIAKVEEEVGEQLLVRSKRNIRPTRTGERFYAIAKRLVVAFQSAAAELRTIRADETGRLSVSCNMTWCSVLMPELVAAFRADFPQFTLNVHEGSSITAVKKVYDGEVDLGITHKPKRLFGVAFEPLLSEEFVVACHRDHPLAAFATVPAGELKKHVWMRLMRGELFASLDWIEFESAPDFPETTIHANHYATLLRFVDRDIGVTVLPRMAANQFHGANVVVRPFEEPFMRRTVGILVKEGRAMSPAALHFAQIVRRGFAAHAQTAGDG